MGFGSENSSSSLAILAIYFQFSCIQQSKLIFTLNLSTPLKAQHGITKDLLPKVSANWKHFIKKGVWSMQFWLASDWNENVTVKARKEWKTQKRIGRPVWHLSRGLELTPLGGNSGLTVKEGKASLMCTTPEQGATYWVWAARQC